MKKLLILLLLCLTSKMLTAQTRWHSESYRNINHTNFRHQPIFLQKLEKHLDYRVLNAVLFFLTNELRAKKGKNPLEYHEALEITAWNHAVQMSKHRFFGHENKAESNRRTVEQRGHLGGIDNPFLRENLGYIVNEKADSYISIGEKLLNQWKAKKESFDLLLSDDNLQLGCGVYFAQNKWHAVQVFQGFENIKSRPKTDKLPH
jgi:uncharacterized protein YkwD